MKDDLGTQLDQLARLSDVAPLPDEARLRHLGNARHRRRRVLMAAGSVGVAAAIATPVAFVVAGTSNPALSGPHSRTVARYVPASARFSADGLAVDARKITERLDGLGYPRASAAVRGNSVVVAATGKLSRAALTAATSTGVLQFRPVLCGAGPYVPSNAPPSSLPGNCSSPAYQMTSSNLGVNIGIGQPQDNVPPDPALARFPSSTPAYNDSDPGQDVLIPSTNDSYLTNGQSGPRLLLGPSSVSNGGISSAMAVFNTPDWDVELNFTTSGAVQWDLLAQEQFHAYIAFDLDGQVISAPLTLPAQSTFTSFDGRVQISGNFTRASATGLVSELDSGSLPVHLQPSP
ncbi:MAG: SecDF P1 head subdomain-containing protein [Acidimicrobiales bacterium]